MPEGAPRDLHAYLPIVVASTPASARQEKVAIALVLGIAAATAALAPFAHIRLARIDSFLPAMQTTLSAADLLTAALLMAQYLIQPQRGLLALGCGYICSGLFAFLQTLAFPGAYAPLGLIGDGFNSPPWFFVLWHTTFPLRSLVYALLKDSKGDATLAGGSPAQTLCATVAAVLGLAAMLSWLAAAGSAYLPKMYSDNVTVQTQFSVQVNTALSLWCGIVLVVLFMVLDLWLVVVLAA